MVSFRNPGIREREIERDRERERVARLFPMGFLQVIVVVSMSIA